MDPLERQIADAVNVDPSPEFVARVRARVASETVSRTRRWPAVAAAGLAATLAIGVYVQRPNRDRVVDGTIAVPVVPPAVSAPAAASAARVEHRSASVVRPRARTTPDVPDVIVAADELRGWRQLADLVRSGYVELRFDEKEKTTLVELPSVKEIVVKPIDIAPLTVASNSEQGDEQ